MKRCSQFTSFTLICLLLVALVGSVSAQSMDMMDDMGKMDKMGDMDMMMSAPDTCSMLPAGISVMTDTPGVHCQAVSGGGIGPFWLANAGAMAAVDIWGMMYLDAEVCFEDSGSVTFLDASMSPRMQMDVDYAMDDHGRTCAHISKAGTVVLMPGMMMMDDMMMDDMMMDDMHMDDMAMDDMAMDDMHMDDMAMDDMHMDDMAMDDMAMDDMHMDDMAMDDMAMDDMDMMEMDYAMLMDSMDSMIPLEGCEIVGRYNLNFRDEPGGAKIGLVPGGVAKAAHARTPNWFKVEHDDMEGWVSAHYIHGHGDCG